MQPDSTPAASVPVRVTAAPGIPTCADPDVEGTGCAAGLEDAGRADVVGDATVPADMVPADMVPADPVALAVVLAGLVPLTGVLADTVPLAAVLADTAGPDDEGAGVDGEDPHAASTANAAAPRRIRADRWPTGDRGCLCDCIIAPHPSALG
jgi:hypothetical protein